MAYVVYLSEQAKTELATIKRSGDKKTIKKIANLLIELQEHPRTGTGQVEHLKHFVYEETWSRRINKQYRMIYEIHDLEIYVSVVSLRSHYGDKWIHFLILSFLFSTPVPHFEPHVVRLMNKHPQGPWALWVSAWSVSESDLPNAS